MYAKLMGRITESSLMEEEVPVRYCFMMLLAMADPKGYVVGTDVAIARRMNVPLLEFQECLVILMQPDQNSNSQEYDGRRVIESDCERGYFIVNYVKYRDTRDEEQRREYMRDYMQRRRELQKGNKCKQRKQPLAQEEVEVNGEVKEEVEIQTVRGFGDFWKIYPVKVGRRNAEKAWKQRKCDEIIPQILSSLEAHLNSDQWIRGIIPHLTTWINRHGWEDEVPARTSHANGKRQMPAPGEAF